MADDPFASPDYKSPGGGLDGGARNAGKARLARARALPLVALALLALLPGAWGGTLRVTTWNLGLQANLRTNDGRLEEVAVTLRQINPDVILLQQAGDWKLCGQLAQALKPAQYTVQVCSSFRDSPGGTTNPPQVAILSRAKAYFSWSEGWQAQGDAALRGGFAFAALQLGQQRIGFLSAHVGAVPVEPVNAERRAAAAKAQAASAAQLLEQVRTANNWVDNRVEAFVVGVSFDTRAAGWAAARDGTLRALAAAEFGDAFGETPGAPLITLPGKPGQPGATADYILIQPSGCAANPSTLAIPASGHYPVTCDVELDPVKVAVARAVSAEAIRARQAAPVPPAASATPQLAVLKDRLMWLAALGAIAVLAGLVWFTPRRRRSFTPPAPALLTAGGDVPASFTLLVGTHSTTGATSTGAAPPQAPEPVIRVETPEGTHTQAEVLRRRAVAAEQRAERAQAMIRQGLLPDLSRWLKQKLVHKLLSDREQLLKTQQAAAHKVVAVEERLSRIEQQVQRQNETYQSRIEALTRELLTTKEENRELIRARIAQIKAEMAAARTRLIAQSERDSLDS